MGALRMVSLYKMFFSNEDGSIQGEIGIIPELDDRNDAGYDAVIPEGSRIHMKKLSADEAIEMMTNALKAGKMW